MSGTYYNIDYSLNNSNDNEYDQSFNDHISSYNNSVIGLLSIGGSSVGGFFGHNDNSNYSNSYW